MLAQLHHHMEVLWRLKAVHELEHILVVHFSHDLSLSHCIPNLVVVDKGLLLHRLHCIDLSSIFVLNFEDATKGSLTQ